MANNDEIQLALDELETRLDRLRALYEQYFTGIEKAVPAVQHKDVERRIQTLRKLSLRNTAQRFRFQTLIQKYTTYLQYWQRILRRIEEGTHKRDLARAARYGVKPRKPAGSDGVYELDPDAIEDYAEDEEYEEVEPDPSTEERAALQKPAPTPAAHPAPAPAATRERQIEVLPFDVVEAPVRTAPLSVSASPAASATPSVRPATAQPAATPAPASAPSAGQTTVKRPGLSVFGAPAKPTATAQPALMKAPQQGASIAPPAQSPATTPSGGTPRPTSTDAALRQLYERYRDARKQNGEAEVDFDVVARQVRDTLPKLREKYPGQNVDLDVSVKDGRTILRPVVKPKK